MNPKDTGEVDLVFIEHFEPMLQLYLKTIKIDSTYLITTNFLFNCRGVTGNVCWRNIQWGCLVTPLKKKPQAAASNGWDIPPPPTHTHLRFLNSRQLVLNPCFLISGLLYKFQTRGTASWTLSVFRKILTWFRQACAATSVTLCCYISTW